MPRDGSIAQGWGGTAPNGIHVNAVLAEQGSPTAATLLGTLTHPTPGFTPILVCTGVDQPSYETVYPPTIMLNKTAPATEYAAALLSGAVQLGVAQGVLDVVADGLLRPAQDTLVFVAVWLDPDADDETATRAAAREAVRNALREAARGRDPYAAQHLVGQRNTLTNPFYGGS